MIDLQIRDAEFAQTARRRGVAHGNVGVAIATLIGHRVLENFLHTI